VSLEWPFALEKMPRSRYKYHVWPYDAQRKWVRWRSRGEKINTQSSNCAKYKSATESNSRVQFSGSYRAAIFIGEASAYDSRTLCANRKYGADFLIGCKHWKQKQKKRLSIHRLQRLAELCRS
jgi:hypothetical protein